MYFHLTGILTVWGFGCTSEPKDVEQNALQVIDQIEQTQAKTPQTTETDGSGTEPPTPETVQPKRDPIYPNLTFIGLSDLHINYFSDQHIIDELGQGLGGLVQDGVDMEVEFSDDGGVIRIFHNQKNKTVADLHPIGTVLGTYRHSVAARYDLRVLSFSVEIVVGKCRFSTLPDAKLSGAFLSPCYLFGRETEPQCGEYTLDGLKFSPMQQGQITTCLENP